MNKHWLCGYLSVRIWRYGRITTSFFFISTRHVLGCRQWRINRFFVIGLIRSGFPAILFIHFFFSIQMPLGMATELQPFLRPIWETTTRLTLYSVMNALGWSVHVDKTTRGNQEVALNWRGTATTEQVLNSWLSCTFFWIFLNDVFIHVVRYSDSEYLNNWYNVPSPIWPFSLKWIPIRINYHRVEIYRPAHLICMLVMSCKQTYWGTYDCYSHDHEVLTVISHNSLDKLCPVSPVVTGVEITKLVGSAAYRWDLLTQ